jgi:hypothetical protein
MGYESDADMAAETYEDAPHHTPDLHPGTLAEIDSLPGATVIRLSEADHESADAAGDPTIWLVTADSMQAGGWDLDNRTIVVGAFARLHDAVTEVMHRVLMAAGSTRPTDGMIYNPQFRELAVRGWAR